MAELIFQANIWFMKELLFFVFLMVDMCLVMFLGVKVRKFITVVVIRTMVKFLCLVVKMSYIFIIDIVMKLVCELLFKMVRIII